MIIKRILLDICEACLKGEGEMCHTPGCALFLHSVDLPIDERLGVVVGEWDDTEIACTNTEDEEVTS